LDKKIREINRNREIVHSRDMIFIIKQKYRTEEWIEQIIIATFNSWHKDVGACKYHGPCTTFT